MFVLYRRFHSCLRTKAFTVNFRNVRASSDGNWSSSKVRSAFLRYFQNQDHLFVPSSSVIPNKLQGTYFTNAGMNQFKPLFLGTVDPKSEMMSYRRVVNSQKCIRVGGKHNDLDEVGQDLTHHTFFEMLGNWSFGDYFKEQACRMALELLTSEYGLPENRLYFTYFGGDKGLNLQPDTESRDIWRSLGIPSERILPFAMRDNFWDMGDTGPCGPCTEIHYDHMGAGDRTKLVNADSPDVVEIWNLVFMQYQRHEDKSLTKLSQHHVDTGMGLERILAILNQTRSNYDTDLFLPLFAAIQKSSGGAPYRGRVGPADAAGIDAGYRILADHARMYTVAIADGLMPNRIGLGHKVRQLIFRCVRLCQTTFKVDPHLLCDLVDLVAESLGEAFPEIVKKKDLVKSVVGMTVDGYLHLQTEARQAFVKMLKQTNTSHVTGETAWQLLDGKYGCPVPIEMVVEFAREHGITVDVQGFEECLQAFKEKQDHAPVVEQDALSQECLELLRKQDVATTDDSFKYTYSASQAGYDFSEVAKLSCRVVGLVQGQEVVPFVQEGAEAGVILDKTCFYAEGGGQASDMGTLVSPNGQFAVDSVKECNGFVVHRGRVVSGTLHSGQNIHPAIVQEMRCGCMKNHTATHLLQSSLRHHLEHSTAQQGSSVRSNRLSFDFLCLEKLSLEKLQAVESSVKQLIGQRHQVRRTPLALQEALACEDIVTVPNEDYPPEVTLVQIGDLDNSISKELCGGTHVLNTGDIGDFCITKVNKVSQGVLRISAVTGRQATEAHQTGAKVSTLCKEFSSLVASKKSTSAELTRKSLQIKKFLDHFVLPYTVWEHASSVTSTLAQYVTTLANQEKQLQLLHTVEDLLQSNSDRPCSVHALKFNGKQMVKALSSLEATQPLSLVSCDKRSASVVIVWPEALDLNTLRSALEGSVGDSNPMKINLNVNERGSTIAQVSIKGSNLDGWLEQKIENAMEHLTSTK